MNITTLKTQQIASNVPISKLTQQTSLIVLVAGKSMELSEAQTLQNYIVTAVETLLDQQKTNKDANINGVSK